MFTSDSLVSPAACQAQAQLCRNHALTAPPRRRLAYLEMAEMWEGLAAQFERLTELHNLISLDADDGDSPL